MSVSCFNDSRMVGANRYANSKAVGMSFLEGIWLKKVLHNKSESGDQFEKAGRSLLSNLSCFSRYFFPFLCVFFLCLPMPLMPSTALRRLANDSDSDVFQ